MENCQNYSKNLFRLLTCHKILIQFSENLIFSLNLSIISTPDCNKHRLRMIGSNEKNVNTNSSSQEFRDKRK